MALQAGELEEALVCCSWPDTSGSCVRSVAPRGPDPPPNRVRGNREVGEENKPGGREVPPRLPPSRVAPTWAKTTMSPLALLGEERCAVCRTC